MTTTDDIRAFLQKKLLVIGANETKAEAHASKLKKIMVANNCPLALREELEKMCQLSSLEMEVLTFPNDELGVVVKKPFAVTVLGVLKE